MTISVLDARNGSQSTLTIPASNSFRETCSITKYSSVQWTAITSCGTWAQTRLYRPAIETRNCIKHCIVATRNVLEAMRGMARSSWFSLPVRLSWPQVWLGDYDTRCAPKPAKRAAMPTTSAAEHRPRPRDCHAQSGRHRQGIGSVRQSDGLRHRQGGLTDGEGPRYKKRMKELLQRSPPTSLRGGLPKTIASYIANKAAADMPA